MALLQAGSAPIPPLGALSWLNFTCALTFKPLHPSRSGLVVCPCGPPAPILGRTQVSSSDSLCQARGGSVSLEADSFWYLFGLGLMLFWAFLMV